MAAVAAAESGIRTRSGRVLPANAGSLEPLSGALPQHLHAQLPGALPQQLQAQPRSAAAAAGLTAGRDAATAPRGSAYAGRTVQMEVEQSRAGAPHGAGADAERWYSPAGADAGAGAAADAAARPPGAGALPPNGSNSSSSGGAAAHEDWGFGQVPNHPRDPRVAGAVQGTGGAAGRLRLQLGGR